MKKMIIAMVALLVIPIVFSQEAGILLNQYGFGKTPNEVKFTIHCSGNASISNMVIYVDGKEYKRFSFTLNPKRGISTTLILDPGKHLVEVNSSEGAYDSETVIVSSIPNKEPKPKEVISFQKSNTFKILIAFIIISVIIVWLLMKRPKLEL